MLNDLSTGNIGITGTPGYTASRSKYSDFFPNEKKTLLYMGLRRIIPTVDRVETSFGLISNIKVRIIKHRAVYLEENGNML